MMFSFKHTRKAAVVLMLAALSFTGLMAQGDKVYKTSDEGVTAPKLKQHVDPDYTEEAKAAQIVGTVLIAFEVDTDGRARNLKVVRSLDAGLDTNAMNALAQWQFEPATKDGEPVICSAQVEINFALR